MSTGSMRNTIISFIPGAVMAIALWILPPLAGGPVAAQAFASLGLAGAQAFIAVSLGLGLMSLVKCEERSPVAEAGVSLFLGIGVIGLLTLLFGLGGAFSVMAIRVAMSVLAVALSPLLAAWIRRYSRYQRSRKHAITAGTHIPAMIVITVIGLLLCLHATLPPLAFDALEYHLAVPRQWLHQGQIAPIAGNFFSHQPFTGELNFLVSLALGGDALPSVPKWLNLFGLAGIVCVVFGWCKAKGIDQSMRSLAAAMVVTTPIIYKISTDALIDVWVVLGVVSAFHMWHRWILTRRGGALAIAALSLGIITTLKHPATVIWVVPMLVFCLWTLQWHRVAPHEWILSLLALTILAAIPGLPWLIKEWSWTGNPWFPLGYGLFGGRGWSDAQSALLVGGHGLRLPFSLDHWADVWHRRDVLGPCPISLFAGSVLFARRRHRRGLVGSTLGATVLAYLIWNMLGQSADRFLAPAAVVLVVFGVGGLESIVAWTRRWMGAKREALGYLALLAPLVEITFNLHLFAWLLPLALLLAGMILLALRRRDSPLHTLALVIPAGLVAVLILIGEMQIRDTPLMRFDYLIGRRSWGEVTEGIPHLQAHRYLNQIVKPEGAVLFVYESRSFTLDSPAVMGTIFDGQALREFVGGAHDLEGLLQRLHMAGVSHVLVNPYEGERLLNTYLGGAAASHGGPLAPLDPVWNFPVPLNREEVLLVRDFLDWADQSADWRLGRLTITALPDES